MQIQLQFLLGRARLLVEPSFGVEARFEISFEFFQISTFDFLILLAASNRLPNTFTMQPFITSVSSSFSLAGAKKPELHSAILLAFFKKKMYPRDFHTTNQLMHRICSYSTKIIALGGRSRSFI